ncbi:ribokinase [Anoxybacillus sp. LAT_35]|uniref:ribokinase n=1 Tax=unclassified Anoxybacillus TaxID=2639704 RepID=UPI001EEB901E|nr:ribokinase [Anoxybacillus sp. LAT_26]MCG6172623.1 ribokinase [Anoxybacillus sp. LAT_11]MCG6178930.1 ribokinase [Anoxybacillus sp. LAT_35]MCG6182777.1 ribokinase [Anoxybacillus sp. LAT_26]MCG6196683.1 ribokinase [Anoxybacillus sp. LAT_38]
MRKPKITVIGSINMDLVTITKRMPLQGETVVGETFRLIPGGKGANQAVAAARLGADVQMIGAVGTDAFGTELLQHLAKEGIIVDGVKPVTDTETGIATIIISEGDNRIIVVPGANHALRSDDLERWEEKIATSDVCLLQLEIPLPVVERAVSIAKRNGVRVILNPAPAQPLPDTLLDQVDFLTPNEHERDVVLAGRPLKQWAHKLIVTEGKRGVSFQRNGEQVLIPGFRVPVVDTTGAGDTFNGALAVALSKGMALEDACRYANAAAALSVTKLGAQTGMPTERELESFLAEKG